MTFGITARKQPALYSRRRLPNLYGTKASRFGPPLIVDPITIPAAGDLLTSSILNQISDIQGTVYQNFEVVTVAVSTITLLPTGLAVAFTKHHRKSVMTVDIHAVIFATTSLAVAGLGVRITNASGLSIDVEITRQECTVVDTHNQTSGIVAIGEGVTGFNYDLPAATYNVQPYWYRVSGTGTLNVGVPDNISMTVREEIEGDLAFDGT